VNALESHRTGTESPTNTQDGVEKERTDILGSECTHVCMALCVNRVRHIRRASMQGY